MKYVIRITFTCFFLFLQCDCGKFNNVYTADAVSLGQPSGLGDAGDSQRSGVRVLPDSRSQAEEAGWESTRPIKLGCVGVSSIGGSGGFLGAVSRFTVAGVPGTGCGAAKQGCLLLAGVALNLGCTPGRQPGSHGVWGGEITLGGNAAVSHRAWGGGRGGLLNSSAQEVIFTV